MIATGIKPVSIYHTTAGRFVGTKDHKVIENGSRVSAEIADGIDRCVGPKHVDQLSIDPQDVVDGWVIGDGSRLKSTGRVYLNLGVKDGDFHRVLKDYVVKHQPGWNKIAWEVKTTITTDEVPPLPVRTIPDRFLTGSREKVVGFLRGLYSANGSVCGGRITLKATSFELVRGVQMMLSSIGIGSYYTTNAPSAVEWKNGTYTSKQSYDLNITGDKDVFTTQIGFVQEDKQARAVEAAGRGKRPWSKNTFEVLREEAIGEMPVYDIEVEAEEHTYWTDGLLVSNCSEFVFLDDSTCNLACLNLVKLVDPADWVASVAKIKHAARLWTVALDVTVGMSGYPSKKIAEGARKYRTFGLGYANLGGLLMRNGIAYDSDAGRGWAACITAIIHYETQIASASLADRLGAFPRCAANVDHVTRVMKNHAAYMTGAAYDGLGVEPTSDARAWIAKAPKYLREAAALSAQSMLTRLGVVGYAIRNAQTTLVMPAGTVGLLMDCDTTGVEPDFSLVKGKTLAGGGWIKIVNQSVTPALKTLGYSDGDVSAITDYVDKTGAVIGCTQLHQEHLSVFDCAVGQRSISVSGHLKMMAAVQPVLSGAISKTNNMAPEATVDDVREVYNSAHKLMLKCVALYRDGSKLSQPLEAYAEADKPVADSTPSSPEQPTKRKILPNKRKGYTQKVRVGSHKIYIRTGEYPDGKLGEIFLTCHREGAFLRSVMDAYAQAISIALQHNVPLEAFVDACVGTRFEPNGVVQGHDRIKIGTSILDVVMRDLGINYLGRQDLANVPTDGIDASPAPASSNSVVPYDGTPCTVCGALRVKPNGACKVCEQCGTSTGC
jgi:ribonucleoside-diphosphate reductase alpha chain